MPALTNGIADSLDPLLHILENAGGHTDTTVFRVDQRIAEIAIHRLHLD